MEKFIQQFKDFLSSGKMEFKNKDVSIELSGHNLDVEFSLADDGILVNFPKAPLVSASVGWGIKFADLPLTALTISEKGVRVHIDGLLDMLEPTIPWDELNE